MKASISFPELQLIIAEKAKQHIDFASVDRKSIQLTYPLSLGFIKKSISANLIIKELVGTNLLVGVDAGLGTDTMITTVLSLLKGKMPEDLVEKLNDNQLLIHLNKIEELKSLLENVDITDIHVLGEGLEVEGAFKH
jgi:hypothetical protein